MPHYEIHSCEQMIELIQQLGFLPLLASGISGYSAEEMAQMHALNSERRYFNMPYEDQVRYFGSWSIWD